MPPEPASSSHDSSVIKINIPILHTLLDSLKPEQFLLVTVTYNRYKVKVLNSLNKMTCVMDESSTDMLRVTC